MPTAIADRWDGCQFPHVLENWNSAISSAAAAAPASAAATLSKNCIYRPLSLESTGLGQAAGELARYGYCGRLDHNGHTGAEGDEAGSADHPSGAIEQPQVLVDEIGFELE